MEHVVNMPFMASNRRTSQSRSQTTSQVHPTPTNPQDPKDTPPISAPAPRTQEDSTQKYRRHYKERYVSKRYRGHHHLLAIALFIESVMIISLLSLKALRFREIWTLPIVFIIANCAEYILHRYPMHKVVPGLRCLLIRHLKVHHRYFRHNEMAGDDHQCIHATLLSPQLLLIAVFGILTPLSFVAALLFGKNVGLLTLFTCSGYLLFFEVVHAAFHMPKTSPLRRFKWVNRLRINHLLHHNVKHMNKYNFNITFPIFDWLFGTYYRLPRVQRRIFSNL